MATAVSGLAASIRAATESETFDLAGHDAANITTTMTDAFTQPFQLDEMIRLTFVTGGGKLSRSKYDAKAMQSVSAALRQLDYVEDKGASCVIESGGCYKSQHDTGKNIFTIVVFPRLVDQGDEQDGQGGGGGFSSSDEYPIPFPLAEGTPVYTILMASDEMFPKMVPSMCPSWSEKKMCSEVLKLAAECVEKMDGKLMTGTPLSDEENEFYDSVGGVASIGTKSESLKKLMQQQVEKGLLSKSELDKLLEQVGEKIDTLNEEIDTAMQKSQEKKAVKLTAQKEKATARQKMLEGHKPQPPKALKHDAQIMKLRKQLKPLLKLEASTKGRLLTMKETKELAVKEELEEEVFNLEEASRGWFEDDDDFQLRVDASRKKGAVASGAKATGSKAKKAAPRAPAKSTNWLTPGGLASKQAALGKKTAKKKKGARSDGGSAFAAMMMDSDSDSD